VNPFLSHIIARLSRLYSSTEDKFFDLHHGIHTSGVIDRDALSTDSNYAEYSTAYQAVFCSTIRKLVRQCFVRGIRPLVFIDIGCGKGKACFYAATTGKFQKIIGVDFDRSFIAEANANRKRFAKYPIEFLHIDATDYSLDADRQVMVFLFNPFDETVLRIFLSKNLPSIQSQKHVVAYANDVHRSVLSDLGFHNFYRDPVRKISLWQHM
jgi:SAM-dependent methyltransferase